MGSCIYSTFWHRSPLRLKFEWDTLIVGRQLSRKAETGHIPLLMLKNSGQLSNLESSGFATGMLTRARFEPGRIHFKSKEIAVLFTGGISV
jgi:hypothetical protein